MNLNNNTFLPNDKLTLNFGSFYIGYKLYYNNNISFDPYIGIVTSAIQSLTNPDSVYSKNGNCVGFIFNKYFTIKSKKYKNLAKFLHPLIYLNNRLIYNKLSKLNKDLGDFNYSIDVGIGIEFGPKNNKQSKKTK